MSEPAFHLPAIHLNDRDGTLDAEQQRMRDDAAADPSHPGAFSVRICDSIEDAAPAWRVLEARAVLTPYQRYDWIKALGDAGGLDRTRCAIAVIEADELPVALLPLGIVRKFGLSLGTFLGSSIANIDWMPLDPAAARAFDRPALDRLLREIGEKAGGLDALSLHAMPAEWQGIANPFLAFSHQPGPDHLYVAPIGEGAASRTNAKRMRNIMRGKRRLEELMGPVTLRTARTPAEVEAIHRTFLAQRAARFAEQGIANIFAEDWFVRFFREAGTQSLGSPRPTLQFHALEAGGEIVATSCGTYAGTHFSQYINSMTTGPAAKSSLMGLLMSALLDELKAAGITSIDMGLGDFDYKLDWTDRTLVYDAVIPLTGRGRAAAMALLTGRRLRRAFKQNAALFGTYKRLRAMVGKRG